jgi:hypothetical protein
MFVFVVRMNRGSLVSIVTDHGLDRDLILGRDKGFFSSLPIHAGSGAHPAIYPEGTGGGAFILDKVREVRDADHSLPSSAEFKNE